MAKIEGEMEPNTFEEVTKNPDQCDAMNCEYDSIMQNHTWDLVDLPIGKNVAGVKWIYKIKHKFDGLLDRYKARLVAKGYPGGQEPPIGSSISKKPRPLEGGNWVCESPYCHSVNHLGGTECYKCGVWRGAFSENKPGWEPSFPYNKPMGMPPSGPSTVDSSAFRMGPVFEQRPVNDLSGNPSILSVTSEGKRLAEQLVASFAASLNPIQDAAECLASATMWLHQMKAQMPNGDSFPSNYLPAPMRGVSGPLGMNGAGHALEQPHYNSARGWDTHRGPSTYGHEPSGKSLGSPRPSLPPPNVRIEDYWDCPSDYLRKYGDPAATKTASTGVSMKPEVGMNGNWECDKCRNINFPRRTSCFQCKTKRGPEGENIVRNYVRRLIEEAGQRER